MAAATITTTTTATDIETLRNRTHKLYRKACAMYYVTATTNDSNYNDIDQVKLGKISNFIHCGAHIAYTLYLLSECSASTRYIVYVYYSHWQDVSKRSCYRRITTEEKKKK